jgi:hypothetical protein
MRESMPGKIDDDEISFGDFIAKFGELVLEFNCGFDVQQHTDIESQIAKYLPDHLGIVFGTGQLTQSRVFGISDDQRQPLRILLKEIVGCLRAGPGYEEISGYQADQTNPCDSPNRGHRTIDLLRRD